MAEVNDTFALLSNELIFLPTPVAAHIIGYRELFRKLHADPLYCETAFGDHFKPRNWTDEECLNTLNNDVKRRWEVKHMGDFALGIVPEGGVENHDSLSSLGKSLKHSGQDMRVVQDTEDLAQLSKAYDGVQWIGYVCVRDATPACPTPNADQDPLPPWEEMIEVRYGLDPAARGAGIITRAQAAVMQWAVEERGVRRFIAETLVSNDRSAKVLERLGFVRSGTRYFGMDDAVEWSKTVLQN